VPASWLARSRSFGKLERLVEAARALGLGHQPAAELEVLGHRHLREQLPALGHQRDAGAHDLVRLLRQVVAVERDDAAPRDQARQRLEQRRLAGAVGAEDHGQARARLEREVAQHEERSVAGRQALHLQVRAAGAAEHERVRAPPHHGVTSAVSSAISSPR
jgi:hypothetical protein